MTLKECYIAMGSDYEDVLRRFLSEQMIRKYVLKFSDDGNYDVLCHAMEEGLQEEAFRAAHTIKGMCLNLGFTKLGESSSLMTECLRSGDMDGARALSDRVREDYECTIEAIRTFQAGIHL